MMDKQHPPATKSVVVSLRRPTFVNGLKHREQQTRAVRRPADPDILKFERAFIKRMNDHGIPFFSHCIVRTPEQQMQLWREGKSQIQKNGAHVKGMATDLIHSTRAWNLSKEEWEFVHKIGLDAARRAKVPIRWGADWDRDGIPTYYDPDERFYDPAHWELADWRTRPDVADHDHFQEVDEIVKKSFTRSEAMTR